MNIDELKELTQLDEDVLNRIVNYTIPKPPLNKNINLTGIIQVAIYSSEKYNKKIILFGERHFPDENTKCKNNNDTIRIDEYIEYLCDDNPLKRFDLFIEDTDKSIKNRDKIRVKESSLLYTSEKFKREDFPNLHYHACDIRQELHAQTFWAYMALIMDFASYDFKNFVANWCKRIKKNYFKLYNKKHIQPSNEDQLKIMNELAEDILKIYYNAHFPPTDEDWEDLFSDWTPIIDGLNSSDEVFGSTEFKPSFYIKKFFTEKQQIISNSPINTIEKIMLISSFILDMSIISELFSLYEYQNNIIYTGAYHTQTYCELLEYLGFERIYYKEENEDDVMCIDISDMPNIF